MNFATRFIPYLALGLVAALALSPAQAADPDLLNRAQAALQANQPKQAQAILLPAYRAGDHDGQILFLLALAAKQQKDWAAAEKYLTELLQQAPNAARVKLELAEVYIQRGKRDRARELLLEVRASNPPPKVGQNVDAFIAMIDKGVGKAWSAFAGVGLVYDTNVNLGPDTNSILIYNLPFVLSKDARNKEDWAALYRFGGHYKHSLSGNTSIQAGINVKYTDYRDMDNYDRLDLSVSLGPSWSGSNWGFSLPYVFNRVRFGHKEDYYLTSQGLAPQIAWQASPRVLLQASLALLDREYKDNRRRDGEAIFFSPSLRYALDASSAFKIGTFFGRETASLKNYRNHSKGMDLTYTRAFNKRLSLELSTSWSNTDYEGTYVAYGKKREDDRKSLSATLNYRVEPWNSNLALTLSGTDNHSSIKLYSYDQLQLMLMLNKYF